MRLFYFGLMLCFISFSHGFGNVSWIEQKFTFALMNSEQDTTAVDTKKQSLEPFQKKEAVKSPGKAMLYSGILPGMGQAYMGNWMRALLFVAIDGVAIGTWYHNNNLAEEKKKEYSYFANDYWDFGRWVHDYYKWKPKNAPEDFSGNQELWTSIREVFVNKTDSNYYCHESPYCYVDIWDHSHKVEFTWDGNIVSSSDENDFRPIFMELCGIKNSWTRDCSNSIAVIEDSLNAKSVYVIKDHHFYEGIQKYDMFFAGWDDNDKAELAINPNGDKNATSPNQKAYRNLWGDYNTVKTLAMYGGKFMLINRVVSMVDALLLAKKWNNEHDVKLSLNTYLDLRNKSGVGGMKLSLRWK